MEVLQWGFILGISLGIISIIFTLYFILSFFYQRKKINELPSKKSSSKRRRKKALRKLARLEQRKQKSLRNSLLFLILGVVFSAGAYYITFYQATTLSAEDTKNIVNGYYYLSDLEKELTNIQNQDVIEETSQETLTYVATSLAGYAPKKANTLNTVNGQSVLNRYYSAMSELGINVSRQAAQLYRDEELVSELLRDVEKVSLYQKNVLDFFKVDEASLKAEN